MQFRDRLLFRSLFCDQLTSFFVIFEGQKNFLKFEKNVIKENSQFMTNSSLNFYSKQIRP